MLVGVDVTEFVYKNVTHPFALPLTNFFGLGKKSLGYIKGQQLFSWSNLPLI